MALLDRYINSALAQAQIVRNNPLLIRQQQVEDMVDSLAKSSSAQQLHSQFVNNREEQDVLYITIIIPDGVLWKKV